MNLDAKIYVAGHRGLVGSAIVRQLNSRGFKNIVLRSHNELDLTDKQQTNDFMFKEKPDVVYLAAAKVGGIVANASKPVNFLHENLSIQQNVMESFANIGGKDLIFLGSNCIYPKFCPQPIKEEYLLTGPLEPTNSAYAIAKIAGVEGCLAFNKQYSTKFFALMPANLYGPGDNYNLADCHVLPALIRKTHEAKLSGADALNVWGDGSPRREFMYSDDIADAAITLALLPESKINNVLKDSRYPIFNVGTGSDMPIRDVAKIICEEIGFTGRLEFDVSKPNGTPRKLMDTTLLSSLGWAPKTDLRTGIAKAYASFLQGASRV
jgi:GDP-L-fucose synthase